MNTRQIHHFLALMNMGSLSAAAESENLSQPALSRSIRALEETLGVPLFDRSERRLRPTPFAQAWLPRAQRMVNDEKESFRLLELMNNGESGTLMVGMGSSLNTLVLAPLLLWCMKNLPEVRLRTRVETSDRLLQALRAEQLDYFLGDISIAATHSDLVVEPLHPYPVDWYVRANHPLAKQTQVSIEELNNWPLMVSAGWSGARFQRAFCDIYHFSPSDNDNLAVMTDDVHIMQQVLSNTNAIAYATNLALLNMIVTGEVVRLNVQPAPGMIITLGIIRLSDRMLLPVAKRTFTFIRQHLGEINKMIVAK